MKTIARLTLFFSLNFALLFLAGTCIAFLSSWVDFIRSVPLDAGAGQSIRDLCWLSLPSALYLSILLVLSYTAREKMPIFLSMIGVFVLASLFSLGVSFALSRTGTVSPVFRPVESLHALPGRILSSRNNAVIPLANNSQSEGPRLISIPGQPLIYQELPLGMDNAPVPLPPLPFGDSSPQFLRSIAIDLALSSAVLRSRFQESLLSFALYAFSLALFLASLRFIFDVSRWPLANLLLGALIFRVVLALESYLNTDQTKLLLDTILQRRFPIDFLVPMVFSVLAVLLIFYTLLHRSVRFKRFEDAETY